MVNRRRSLVEWYVRPLTLALLIGLLCTVPVAAAASASPEDGPGFADRIKRFVAHIWRERHKPERVRGTVSSVEDGTLLVSAKGVEMEIETDLLTRFVRPGDVSFAASDISAGDFIVARGRRSMEGFHADWVMALDEVPTSLQGKILSIEGASLMLETDEGEVVVDSDADTRYVLPGVEGATLEALAVGESVRVFGISEAEGLRIQARLIVAPRRKTRFIEGDVVAIDAETLTLNRRVGGELVVAVEDETKIVVPTALDPTFAQVNVGDHVHLRVQVTDEAVKATRIKVIPPEAATLRGTVVSVGEREFVIQTRLGQEIEVEVSEVTRFVIPGLETPSISDLWVDDRVRINGTWEDTEHFVAWEVGVKAEDRMGRLIGRLLSLDDDRLTLGTPDGMLVVWVDDETLYQLEGVDDGTFQDLEKGERLEVRGFWQIGGVLLARKIREIH